MNFFSSNVSVEPCNYKSKTTFEGRKKEATNVLNKYPEKIPVICEVHPSCKKLIELSSTKYIVPRDLTIGQFLITLRKKIKLNSAQNIFLFNEAGTLFTTTQLLSTVYQENKDPDGFLYITVSIQEAFGALF